MKIHLVAICGTGMGSLAGLLKDAGHQVQGSDRAFYPPMSDALRAWGIPTFEGFSPAHLSPDLDLVVVGNACRKDNPEAKAALEAGLRVQSFPETLCDLFLEGRRSLVVAGTHGKTTTTSLLAYTLVQAGRDPGFLVGGVPLDFGRSFRLGQGPDFVVEGDEYDTAFFDKRPKFVHYRPERVILTSVEYDHADIYASMDAYRAAFRTLIGLIPENGLLVYCADDPEVRALSLEARCPGIGYGLGAQATFRAVDLVPDGDGMRFRLLRPDHPDLSLRTPLPGRHNVLNTLGCLALLDSLGIPPTEAAGHFKDFQGVARRMQVRGEVDGVVVLDDFAHHPTAVAETIAAARARYGNIPLWAIFEPRSNSSRRRVFQERYAEAFGGADHAVLVPPFDAAQIPEAERFDAGSLVAALQKRGQDAHLQPGVDELVAWLSPALRGTRAVVLIMSNGAFGGIHEKLLRSLRGDP